MEYKNMSLVWYRIEQVNTQTRKLRQKYTYVLNHIVNYSLV